MNTLKISSLAFLLQNNREKELSMNKNNIFSQLPEAFFIDYMKHAHIFGGFYIPNQKDIIIQDEEKEIKIS
eukprot:COSAG01_NODE_1135_length_11553_cov_40.402305_6_plen_71_part_00